MFGLGFFELVIVAVPFIIVAMIIRLLARGVRALERIADAQSKAQGIAE